MKVIDAFQKDSPAISFEFFPPKTAEQEAKLFAVITELKEFAPDFVSVTYGAMGNTREKSFFWVREIKQRYGLEPVAHLTCVAATRESIASHLAELRQSGVENILALRGDPPQDQPDFVPPAKGFKLAKELIAFIKKEQPAFCLGAAGFPEGHPRSPGPLKDIEYLKEKVDAGAEYVITQLFFDNHHYFAFVKRCEQAGLRVPIIPGLMPITNFHQIKKLTSVCGATLPADLLAKLEEHQSDQPAINRIGVEHSIEQARELLAAGVKGLHFFVMNQSGPIAAILSELPVR